MSYVIWLPDLVLLSEYGNGWKKYLEALYSFYTKDFIETKPIFRGNRLAVKKRPLSNGKEAAFWHIIQEGEKEDERIPDLRRCERIRWPKPIIDHCDECEIKVWENTRRGRQESICIWFEWEEYLVVLRKRTGYILFWTAYPVTEENRKRKLTKEYNSYKNRQAPP